MQLGLQDFGVQLKTVQMGPDVMASATEFKPDIIFIDVLLQKKSGYEVARELKDSTEFGSIPIVLMWSGFMEFSEEKAKATGAEGRLEKPFDSEILRNVTKDLVPRLKQHALSGFLSTPFIAKPELTKAAPSDAPSGTAAAVPPSPGPISPRKPIPTPPPAPRPVTPVKPVAAAPVRPSTSVPTNSVVKPIPVIPLAPPVTPHAVDQKTGSWSLDDFPAPPVPGLEADTPTTPGVPAPASEDFTSQPLAPLQEDQPVSLELETQWKSVQPAAPAETSPEPAEEWQKRELSDFTVNVPLDQLNGEVDVKINPNIDADIEFKTSVQQRFGSPPVPPATPATPAKDFQGAPKLHPHAEKELKARQAREAAAAAPALSQNEIQKLVHDQTEALLKEMIQKIVPEMATRLIQAEIDRLLSERSPDE